MLSLGVIFARGGSKRLPRKNVKPLLGSPLVAWMCRAARASSLSRVVVSTEDEEIAAICESNGVAAPFRRPAALAEDYAGSPDIMLHALDTMERLDGRRYALAALLQPTTPFVLPEHIDACLERMTDPRWGLCFSARRAADPPQWIFAEDGEGRVRTVLGKGIAGDQEHSQKLAAAWFPNGACYVVRTEALRRTGLIFSDPMCIAKVADDRSIDVDDVLDWAYAEAAGRSFGFRPVGNPDGELPAEIRGRRVTLRRFGEPEISDRYLGWLSDAEVNRYSRRQGRSPVTADQARAYLTALRPDEVILGIHTRNKGHVGNVKYGPIDRANGRADISILLGERGVWGCGIGSEAIYLVTRHLFQAEGLHRVDAGSNNPAFLRLVEKLGWRQEGVLRDYVQRDGRWHDHVLVSLLSREFQPMPGYEA